MLFVATKSGITTLAIENKRRTSSPAIIRIEGLPHAMPNRTILAISCVVLTAIAGLMPVTVRARHDPPLANTIVLFGAHWCAPCRAEYRILPALAAAAAPNRLVLAWVDRSIALPADLKTSGIEVLAAEHAQALADRIGGEGYGLPFSAIFDVDGRLCSLWQKPLRRQDVKTLQATCASGHGTDHYGQYPS